MASPYFLTDYPYLFEFLLNSGEELAGNILKSTTLETGGNAFLSSLGVSFQVKLRISMPPAFHSLYTAVRQSGYQLYLYTAGMLGRISNSQIFYLSGEGNQFRYTLRSRAGGTTHPVSRVFLKSGDSPFLSNLCIGYIQGGTLKSNCSPYLSLTRKAFWTGLESFLLTFYIYYTIILKRFQILSYLFGARTIFIYTYSRHLYFLTFK